MIRNEIYQHIRHFWVYIFFGGIFLILFSTAAGLFNSIDTPQFFTTQAIIHYQSLDISKFSSNPHYFVKPDVYNYHNQTLNLRGYLFSIIVLPIHLIASIISTYISTAGFPPQIITPEFKFELAVTALYCVYPTIGLYYIWKTLTNIHGRKLLNSVLIIF